MKYRVVKRNGKFIPQIKRKIKWNDIKKTDYDPRDHESYQVTVEFSSEKATLDFIKKWHSENIEKEKVVSEFEL